MKKILVVFLINMLICTALAGNGWGIESGAAADAGKKEARVREATETIKRPKAEYVAEGSRDPFQAVIGSQGIRREEKVKPVKEEEIEIPEFTVQGIIRSSNFNQAIINNKVVKAGDIIEDAEVIVIDKTGIILLFEGRQISLFAPAEGGTNIPKED